MALPSLPGGAASKIADLYEATWTVGSVLDVLEGTIDALHLEPQGEEGQGVEFYRVLPDGTREYHSVRRQSPDSTSAWTPYQITNSDPRTGRSILGDLFGHLDASGAGRAVFVSQDSARAMRELSERARAMDGIEAFTRALPEKVRVAFEKYIVPTVRNETRAHERLQRCEFRTVGHHELIGFVEQRIPAAIQHADGTPVEPAAVRLLLQEFAWSRLGQVVVPRDVAAELERRGLSRQPLAASAQVQDRIADRNNAYRHHIHRTLINGEHISRRQAKEITEDLLSSDQSVLLAGKAGEGKSCIVAQTLDLLSEQQSPHMVLAMDDLDGVISTAELGRRLGLPASPAIVLGQMSAQRGAVLCIDQLDAISSVSGRNVRQRQVLEELIHQASRYPRLRLLLACRSFDLEHDDALLGLVGGEPPTARRVDVEPLSVDDVRAALATAGLGEIALSESQIQLLRTPLHLYLLLGTGRRAEGFGSSRDLFDRYWCEKRRRVDERAGDSAFAGAAERLAFLLSDRRQLHAPRTRLTHHESAIEAMASEGVVVLSDRHVSFFHATFFDYAFARGFVNRGQSLPDWLSGDRQELFRRSQVRQVLEFLREDDDTKVYLEALTRLLRTDAIRFHLKRLALDWLGQLPDPRDEEWTLLEQQEEPLRPHILRAVRNREAWFRLLCRNRAIRAWLTSERSEDRDHAFYLLRAPNVFEHCSNEAANLLRALVGGRAPERQFLRAAMSYGDTYHSREMMELFLDLIDDGTLDDVRRAAMQGDWWSTLYRMATERPDYCAEAIGHWTDRQRVLANSGGDSDLDRPGRWSDISRDIIKRTVAGAPLAFAREITPRVARAARGPDARLWNDPGITRGEIVEGLSIALRSLAGDAPHLLDELFRGLDPDPPLIIDRLKLDAWGSKPERYSTEILGRLLDREELLSTASVGRALSAGTAAGDRDLIARLEDLVLDFARPGETGRWFRYSQHVLLAHFADGALSERGLKRRTELRRKFSDKPLSSRPLVRRATAQRVPPRIPDRAVAGWSDDEWLRAMHTVEVRRTPGGLYDLDWDRATLSSQLRERSKLEPKRFARLAAEAMPSDLPSRYFGEILGAIADTTRDSLPFDLLIKVLRRLHGLPGRPCGREIARAVRTVAGEAVPTDVIAAIAFYATEDPDPRADAWMSYETGDRNPDDRALTAAINSVRGAAAEATAALLFADPARIELLGGAVDALTQDLRLSVRSVAVLPLLAILPNDETRSLGLFRMLCEDAEPILGTPHIEEYLHRASYRSYEAVRPILLRMFEAEEVTARQAAARQVCLAALNDGPMREKVIEDLARVENGDAAMRTAVAEVYARNCGHPDVAEQCIAKLPRFFDDEDKRVRETAAQCFRRLDANHLSEPEGLVGAFAESEAFLHSPTSLLFRLKGMTGPLPSSTLVLAERAVVAWGREAGDISTSLAGAAATLSELVVRCYAQASGEEQGARTLDAIDRMLEREFLGIDDELAAVDRA